MKKLFAVLALTVVVCAGPAHANSHKEAPTMAASCDAQAADKKLAGAAKTSFLKKCNADSMASGGAAGCEAQAAEKKLAGAAKTSFVKKCSADAAAPAASAAKPAAPASK